MTKRAADRQITKDDADRDDADDGPEDDGAGGDGRDKSSNRASDDVLAQRRILKVKRNDDGTWKRPAGPNPFASLQLVASSTVAAPTVAAATAPPSTVVTSRDGAAGAGSASTATATASTASTANGVLDASGSGREKKIDHPKSPAPAVDPRSTGDTTKKEEPAKKPSIFGSASGFSGFGSVASVAGGGSSTAFSGFGAGFAATTEKGGFGSFGGASSFGGFAEATKVAVVSSLSSAFGSALTAATTASSTADTGAAEEEAQDRETLSASAQRGGLGVAPSTSKQPLVALPTDYELISGEEQEEILLEMRSRTYRWGPQPAAVAPDVASTQAAAATLSVPPSSSSSFQEQQDSERRAADAASAPRESSSSSPTPSSFTWLEAGLGPLRLLRHPETRALRLVQRRESAPFGPATKVVWNVPLWRESSAKILGDKHVQVSTLAPHSTLILCKCATAAQAADLLRLLNAELPQLKSAYAAPKAPPAAASGDDTADPTGPEPQTSSEGAKDDKEAVESTA